MAAAVPLPSPSAVLAREQRILVNGVRWKDYVILREALDTPGLRMTFCEGSLEIMSPSRLHEFWKKSIARAIEIYAYERRLSLFSYGSTTFRREAKQRGAEPDECYRIGSAMKEGEFPDIVLEVVHESPLLDKLHVYLGFEVPEVWLFEKGEFRLFRLESGAYQKIDRSRFLPEVDFSLVAHVALSEDQPAALLELGDRLRAR
jgi:Uma2 family endonuclease